MNPETMLEKVCRSLDILIALGATYEGLFPSIIDRSTHQMMTEMPPGIAGQRDGDRSHLGSNLIHDQTALKTMYALAEAFGPSRLCTGGRPVFAAVCNPLYGYDNGYFSLGRTRVLAPGGRSGGRQLSIAGGGKAQ